MAKNLFSFTWNRKKHEKVETYKTLGVCLRDFSLHCDYDWHVDGYSVGLGWLQISWGMFSHPLSPEEISSPEISKK